MDELTERTREESRALARRKRVEARRAVRGRTEGFDEVRVRLRGGALETRRQLRPVFAPVSSLLSWVAPRVSGGLLFVVRLFGAMIALLLEVVQVSIGWLAARTAAISSATVRFVQRTVTPMRTAAFLGAAAAVALGVSQFFDFRGVAIDAPAYAGELGATAPVPVTDTESAGSAHMWILLPIALVALCLVVATYLGRTRLAGGVALCGLLGLAVALAVDLPQGLDAGRSGIAFSGSEARLLEGFWAEVSASVVLILCGGLLALYSRGVTGGERRRRTARGRRASRNDVGGVSPGLQTES
jgi:hypothetical protein